MRIIGNNPAADNAEITAVASGTLPDGKPVIVNADGTVSVVSSTTVTESLGSAVVFESVYIRYVSATYDANAQKVVIVYFDEGVSDYGRAVVGTVSGTSISFGSPTVFESARADFISATYDANAQKVVIAYADGGNSSYGTAIVGTVSGTSISFGSAVVFESANSQYMSATYDANAQKLVIAYLDGSNSFYGTAIVGTVSGTSISFGSSAVFESAIVRDISTTYDASAQKVVIAYWNDPNLDYGTAVVGTVSGTSISFGTPVVFNSGDTEDVSVVYDSNAQKVVISYGDNGAGRGAAIVGTVSGTSISFGSPGFFSVQYALYPVATYDATAKKVVIAFSDYNNSYYGTVISGTVSGTSISFDSSTVFKSSSMNDFTLTYDANAQKVVVAYKDGSNSNYGTGVVSQTGYVATNLTSENFIGFTDGAAADTGTAKVQVGCGINGAQSSLTAGQQYFVQTDGTIGTTAADPSVIAGTAISATEIIVKG